MIYPIVIPLHHCGGKLKDDTELRYALRSLDAHFKDMFKIVIVGKALPAWLHGVELIQSDKGLKTALLDAANAFPDGFFWLYDDFCLLQDMTSEEMKVTPAINRWMNAKTGWANSLEKIRKRLVEEGRPAFDYSRPHGPYWFDKSMVDEGFTDWPGMKSKFPWESWILSKRDWPRRFGAVKQYYGAFNGEPGNQAFLNYADNGNTPELRSWLEKRFPVPSKFEKGADTAAKFRFRIKSEEDGPVYQGQKIVKKCGSCHQRKPTPKIEVHTIRFGSRWWLNMCAPTLDSWCSRNNHQLRIWSPDEINVDYPDPKFCQIDMLREFVDGDNDWMIYVDSDVYVDANAPAHPPLDPGYWIREDIPGGGLRDFNRWCRRNGKRAKDWTYRNAGVWMCDKESAQAMLRVICPPYISGCMEQHQWNFWLSEASRAGLRVGFLGAAWNAWAFEEDKGSFYHMAGKKKSGRLRMFRANGRIPYDSPPEFTNPHRDSFELVIARFNENIEWSERTGIRTTVYNKGEEGDLLNLGFEPQTFFHHFATRYDSLSEVTVCLQGDPDPHLPSSLVSILNRIDPRDFVFLPIAKHSRWQMRDGSPHHVGLGPANERIWKTLMGHCPPDLWYAWYGGQFAVHRDRVLSKPREFWVMAAREVKTKEDACAIERMWPYLFL